MEVNAEAKRILAVSISKLYASRSQRGGLRLHRSLLLSLVMRSARDIYHSSAALLEKTTAATSTTEEAMEAMDTSEQLPEKQPKLVDSADTEDKENHSPARRSRKRPGKVSAAPDFLPEKRARLEPGEERHAAALSSCRATVTETLSALPINRVISAF